MVGRVLRSGIVYAGSAVGSIAGSVALMTAGWPSWLAIGVVLLAATLWLLVLQRIWAFRDDWRRWGRSAGVDIAHFILSTGVVSLLVEIGIIATIVTALSRLSGGVEAGLWPGSLSLAPQILLALMIGELGAYLVHRSAHRWPLLWRFHAVHHSSEQLYVFAAGRNHPVNVMVTTLAATLPLALLGAPELVLASVSIFTAVHGMLQHANIDFRLGPLNYVFSGPELHRRHHSVREEESHSNFSSSLSIWDLVFGTFALPDDEVRLRDVGLPFLEVRRNFFAQLAVPFSYARRVRDEAEVLVAEVSDAAARACATEGADAYCEVTGTSAEERT